jgi:hypothetical protein
MKWKHESPKLGDTRREVKMAWLPTKLSDGYTVWLETYRVHLRYEARTVPTKFIGIHSNRMGWFEIGTETLWRTL